MIQGSAPALAISLSCSALAVASLFGPVAGPDGVDVLDSPSFGRNSRGSLQTSHLRLLAGGHASDHLRWRARSGLRRRRLRRSRRNCSNIDDAGRLKYEGHAARHSQPPSAWPRANRPAISPRLSPFRNTQQHRIVPVKAMKSTFVPIPGAANEVEGRDVTIKAVETSHDRLNEL